MAYMDFDRFQQAFKTYYRANPKMVDGKMCTAQEDEAMANVLKAVKDLGIEVPDDEVALQNIKRTKEIIVENDGSGWNSEVANLWRYFKPVKSKKPRKVRAKEAEVKELPEEE